VHTETPKKMFQAKLCFWVTVHLSIMTVLHQATSVSAQECVFDSCDLLLHERIKALEAKFGIAQETTTKSTVEHSVEVCNTGFFLLPGTHSCYKLITEKLSWEASKERCASLTPRSHLVDIDNADEDTAISDYLKSLNYTDTDVKNCLSAKNSQVYTGGQRIDPKVCASKTDFVWKLRDGETKEMNYTNWNSGEPNCAGTGGEHCLAYYTTDYTTTARIWNDINCGQAWCSICETSPMTMAVEWNTY